METKSQKWWCYVGKYLRVDGFLFCFGLFVFFLNKTKQLWQRAAGGERAGAAAGSWGMSGTMRGGSSLSFVVAL